MNNGVDWGLRSKSGLLGTKSLMSDSTENLRVGEVSRVGGVQPPAMGELEEVWHSEDVGESPKGFHSVLALLICGLSSAEDFCRYKFYISHSIALGIRHFKNLTTTHKDPTHQSKYTPGNVIT